MEIVGPNGSIVRSFKELLEERVGYFEVLFKQPTENAKVEQMQVLSQYPRFFYQDMNDAIGIAITKEEIN